jgi:uncharacterized protein (TIGR00730 family)
VSVIRSICVYCGANAGVLPDYADAARRTAALLTENGITIVYGGGSVGLMGILADAALASGGSVIGVIPRHLTAREIAHDRLTELHVVGSMHERKALMMELSDAFIALPGGLGTLEELFEILTWSQLGLHAKPCGLLNVRGYYDPLVALLDRAVDQRFLRPEHRGLLLAESDVGRLLERLRRFEAPRVQKWLTEDTGDGEPGL